MWKNQRGGERVKNSLNNIRSRSLLCAAAGLLAVLVAAAGSRPATAQSSDAANLCTGDVMRLCSEFIPDADRIVVCLKAKRRQLSSPCVRALSGGGGKAKKRHVRQHRA